MTEMAGTAAVAEVLTGDPHQRIERADARHDCANCGTHLTGPYCHQCGQKGHLHTRIWHMAEDFIEGVMHFDGRLWRTLPMLTFRPGRLSRAWIEGKRVRYVAPLHIFLFSIFLFFLALSLSGGALYNAAFEAMAKDDSIPAAQSGQSGQADPAASTSRAAPTENSSTVTVFGEETNCTDRDLQGMTKTVCTALTHIRENPKLYAYKAETTTYKLAPLLAPVTMIILAVLLVFKRGYTFYDHGVVALYGLSFMALTITTAIILNSIFSGAWPIVVTLALLVHAVAHLRGAYRLSWFGSVLRALVLGWVTMMVFGSFLFFVAAWSAA